MTEQKIVQKEDNSPKSEDNQPNDNGDDYLTGDDNKEVNNKSDSSSQDDYSNTEVNNKSDSSSQDDDSNTEEVMPLSLKDNSDLFVLSVDEVPRFYTKTIEEAREKMWAYAKCRRIQETHYNTYIRACSDKNRLEISGSNKFSVFMVDRIICRLLISAVQEFETINEQKTFVQTNVPGTPSAPPTTPTTPPVESPPKRSFFSSFFW